ncbi:MULTISPECIES: DEAD/DEAH box helicase [Psychrilyobacter]|uniref:ATP-dependent helicase n=1 Tax=Psychrilyobacter piezotolerans TaxID=2293438 RepID=A0ABX9KE04_9FUSO|nr:MULTISPECIES: DEAD/DEAH box helicase [Psychrilyobacter]MCS5422022.1 DEAD/DEAH box helicase [Psychrilyobacter sp. S5]NDI78917.1 DEAD/DEAH box helicase [Psychrilyobacter piezotolerans]RDE59310.1 ATP-dependent helicase [Psychrilyobacter sp. S5]REI39840.1 ATP-dependent helicase [Psychrilyobacter piezotolerans]
MYTFKDLGIKREFVDSLKKSGIQTPTPVQDMSIEAILANKDIIAEAPTGTGKTLAFLLPMMNLMLPNNSGIQGLVISPTRELAIQIAEEAQKINCNKINILTVYGGKEYSKQLKEAKGSVDLIIATPGRLVDFINQGLVKLNTLKTLVLDEVDQILLMGFQKEVEIILSKSSKKRQTLCYSATLNTQVKKIAYKITKDPVVVKVEDKNKNDKMKKYLVETTDRWKIDALATMLNRTNPFMAIIFCRTKARVDKIEAKLEERGYNVQKLHSDVPQIKREKIIKSFKKAEIQYLVATDVASRGLDITGVTHIFNVDIPEKAETYIHRIGRTARAGEEGETYLFTDPKDRRVLGEIESLLGKPLERVEYDGAKDVTNTNDSFKKKYNKKIKTRSEERK